MNNAFFEYIFTLKTIAVVGLSPKPSRPSNYVSKYMFENGYDIIPVNPGHNTIFGLRCYSSLKEIPFSIDIVNVFRNSKFALETVVDAIDIGAKAIWLQDGVESKPAQEIAEDNNIRFVMNDCILRRHRAIK